MRFGRSHVCVLGGNPPPREPQRNMTNQPTFSLGQSVCSASDSCDIKLMRMKWHAVVTEVRECKTTTPDGYCYVTVGFWDTEKRSKRATLRQLWSNHLVLDTSDKAMPALQS